MYTTKNYSSKAALKRDVKAGVKVEVFQPGLGPDTKDGTVYLEGPHYPAPHTWYAQATVADGFITAVK